MHALQVFIISICLIALLSLPVIYIVKNAPVNSYLMILFYVFVLIFICRLFVNIQREHPAFSYLENILDGLVHTLQSFSMDEDYTVYLQSGKQVFGASTVAADVYGVIVSILNLCAPILGGAVLLQIFMGIFPKLKVFFHPFCCKYIFSELNEYSITLAEDIVKPENRKKLEGREEGAFRSRPMFLFLNAGAETELRSELFRRARAMGAVCLSIDLKGLSVSRSKLVYYFLINRTEYENVESMNYLLNEPSYTRLWPKTDPKTEEEPSKEQLPRTKMYAFCQTDYSVTMINNMISKRMEKTGNVRDVLVRPIRDYETMAFNLMYHVPLFTSMVSETEDTGKKQQAGRDALGQTVPAQQQDQAALRQTGTTQQPDQAAQAGLGDTIVPDRELHVTFLGSGMVSEEIFKTVFWCGQMAGIQLYIHVLSRRAAEMRKKLEASCPELLESCKKGSDLLEIYPGRKGVKSVLAAPYAILEFVNDIDVERIVDYPASLLKKTDYYVIALGSDEKNSYMAVQLSKELERNVLEEDSSRRAVIVPIIYDDHLAESIRKTDKSAYAPYLIPAGTLKERFSFRNVFMDSIEAISQKSQKLYDIMKQEKRVKDEYSHWSSIARALHAPYKVFTLGCIREIRFEEPVERRYAGTGIQINSGDENDLAQSWTEHRRWNAYLRSRGFSCPSAKQQAGYAFETKQMKNVALKLHPCLVEASPHPFQLYADEPVSRMIEEFDDLDAVSFYDYLLKACLKREDFDVDDMRYFQDRDTLFENCEMLMEKYHISREGLQKAEYKQYDSIAGDESMKEVMGNLGKNDC